MARRIVACAAALLALSCGARGTGEYRAVEETRLVDAGAGDGVAGAEPSQLGAAIARWDS
jgi:hypothetical protein